MKISNKQIMQLINIAQDTKMIEFIPTIYRDKIVELLRDIEKQQSEELREIE